VDYPRGVRPRGDKIQLRYSVDGKRYEETLDIRPTRTGLIDAARILKERRRSAKFGGHSTHADRQFEKVAQQWLDAFDGKRSTRDAYRDSLNIYWSALRGRLLASITPQELVSLDDAIDWPSQKTRANALIPLRQVFSYAVSRGYLTANPAAGLRGHRQATGGGADPYSAQERDALLGWLRSHAAGPVHAYFHTAFFTGMRTGELIALKWSDYNGRSLMVERAYVRREETTTKTGRRRRVVLLPQTVEVLNALPRPIKGGHIFTNQYGRPYESGYHLNKILRKAHEGTGTRQREGPYAWRHTYASLALVAGIRPALIAAQLGHSVQMLMNVYAAYVPQEDDLRELQKMEQTDAGRDSHIRPA
jgi:integrase